MKTDDTGHEPAKPIAYYICKDCEDELGNAHKARDMWWDAMEGKWVCGDCWDGSGRPTTDPLVGGWKPKAVNLMDFLNENN